VNEAGPPADLLTVGVIGVGHLGSYHLQKYAKHELVSRIVLFDVDGERADEQAASADIDREITVCGSLSECLQAADAVSVAAPTSEHFDLAWMAINAGCDVLIEKPIASNAEEGRSLVEAAGSADLVLHVGHVERFNPALQDLDTTELRPGFIESHRLAPWSPRGTDVPVIHDLMVHDLDLILYLVGEEPVDVQAAGVSVITGSIDIANVRLTFPGGCVANVTSSRISLAPMRKMRIFQRDAYLSLDLQAGSRELVRLRDDGEQLPEGERVVMDMEERTITRSPFKGTRDALDVEIDAFLRAVSARRQETGTPDPPHGVSGAEASLALKIGEQIAHTIENT
jgi:predicted dehydrogenase